MIGNLIGAISSLVAIGGGLLTVPFLSACNVRLTAGDRHSRCRGLSYCSGGDDRLYRQRHNTTANATPIHLGYVYLPAVGWVVLASVLTAPLGAKTTHVIQTDMLKKIFVAILYLLGIKMLISLL